MLRDIIRIDEEKCNGCGLCIPNCHEGALQIVDGKARLVSDLMCDGLGACIGYCPEGAISIESRESEPYNEKAVISEMISKGRNIVIAHLKHLKDHNETGYLREGIEYLLEHRNKAGFNVDEVLETISNHKPETKAQLNTGDGCRGILSASIETDNGTAGNTMTDNNAPSELKHWPVQMHLINPSAQYFRNSDLLVAADCVAFTAGNFHSRYLKGKTVVIACPKLDSRQEAYISKITSLIDEASINTITVIMMEVPCCGGLLRIVSAAAGKAKRKVPVKKIIIGINGLPLKEEWI